MNTHSRIEKEASLKTPSTQVLERPDNAVWGDISTGNDKGCGEFFMRSVFRVFALLAAASLAVAASKVAPDLSGTTASTNVDVIVQFITPPTKAESQQLGSYGQLKKVFNNVTAGER